MISMKSHQTNFSLITYDLHFFVRGLLRANFNCWTPMISLQAINCKAPDEHATAAKAIKHQIKSRDEVTVWVQELVLLISHFHAWQVVLQIHDP